MDGRNHEPLGNPDKHSGGDDGPRLRRVCGGEDRGCRPKTKRQCQRLSSPPALCRPSPWHLCAFWGTEGSQTYHFLITRQFTLSNLERPRDPKRRTLWGTQDCDPFCNCFVWDLGCFCHVIRLYEGTVLNHRMYSSFDRVVYGKSAMG